ncbi:MAG: hypothetical protein J3T61_07055, partial [Candidatus Brocadiales bacterium]|nr:hypothetical protein [Candidatus Bathyanammoxibius sp.]
AVQGSFSMEILLPRIVFNVSAPVPEVKNSGPLVSGLHFAALKDTTEATDIKITLINNQPAI